MSKIIRLTKWLWRAWPVIGIVPLFCIHMLLRSQFPQGAELINETVCLVSQLIGGLLVLYSINSNSGIITQKSLLTLIGNYFNEFPFLKRSFTLKGLGGVCPTAVGKVRLSVVRNPQSIEEKIKYLQEQINEIKRDFEQETKDLNDKIDRQAKELSVKIQETNSALRNFESKMDEVTTGGIKPQLFGVLLMIYGAISGYAA